MSWKRKDVSTMIIDSSNVGMASSRTYSSAAVYQTETMNAKSEQAVLLDLSDESKTLMEQMKDIKNQQEEEKSQKQKQNMEDLLKNGIVGTKKSEQGTIQAKSKEEILLLTISNNCFPFSVSFTPFFYLLFCFKYNKSAFLISNFVPIFKLSVFTNSISCFIFCSASSTFFASNSINIPRSLTS